MSKDTGPIATATARNLSNNLYDKRKLGALEIEQQIKELNGNGDKVCDPTLLRFSAHLTLCSILFVLHRDRTASKL